MATLLVIDNYDSFTYNLVQMFRQYPLDVRVFRGDKIAMGQVAALAPDYILISPGPKDPAHAGISMELMRQWYWRVPILGVCLGMQCLNEVFGGRTIRSPQPLHGRTSPVCHEGRSLFAGLPSPFLAARYHSLAVAPAAEALRDELTVTARTADGIIMGLAHRRYPLVGVQFHPESFLTEHGFALIENFLNLGSLEKAHAQRRPHLPAAGVAPLERSACAAA
ncbi:MAG: aminodeoxychorismate/anthranilate synthase component II [Desulfobacterales bacterium]|nr:aminodeoxychorismate/anthranilate synthase component II [Desulfobacterales bacterium]